MNEQGRQCPLSGKPCAQSCAWRVGEDCAVRMMGAELNALVGAYLVDNRLEISEEEAGQ